MSERNTIRNCRLVTAEAVRVGHPDKFCDQLADRLLDEHLKGDPNTRAAIEVMAADGKILVAGEVTTEASVDVERVLKQLCAEVGYTMDELSTDGSLSLEVRLNSQSPDIAQAVGEGDRLSAGDQGIMAGYAADETPERMPLPVVLAQKLCRGLDESRIPWLKPDGKAQVTVLYQDDVPVAVTAIVVSVQHEKDAEIETIRRGIKEVIAATWPHDSTILRGEMLAGLGEFWRRYGEKLPVAQFEARMRKHLPMEMYQEARRRTQGKTTPATAFNKTIRFTMCAVFVKAYNKQLRTNSPNRLELEWDHEDEE